MLERRHKDGWEGSHNGSSDYATSTPSLSESRYPNLTQLIDQFIHKKDIKITLNNTVETSSNQLPYQDYETVTRVPCRFYRKVPYDNQL